MTMNKKTQIHEIELYYVTKTENAICVIDDLDCGEEVWLPLFNRYGDPLIDYEIDGTKVTIRAPEDLLTRKGLV